MMSKREETLATLRKSADELAPDGCFEAIDALRAAMRRIEDAAGDDAREVKHAALAQLFAHYKALGWLEHRNPGMVSSVIEEARGHRGLAQQVGRLCSKIDREAKDVARAAHGRGHVRLAHTSGADDGPLGESDAAPTANEDFTVPPGYAVDPTGVWRATVRDGEEVREQICSAPIVVTGYGSDVETDQCVTELTWRIGSSWRKRVVPLAVAGDSRAIVSHLRPLGAPVTSANARQVVHFLDHQMSIGLHVGTTKETRAVSRMGWVKVDGAWSFVWGREVIGPARLTVQADDGFAQLADACSEKGSWNGYRTMMRKLDDAPGPWLMTWASVASILLRPLGLPGYTIDLAGDTSKGKSTSLTVGLAAVGLPKVAKEGTVGLMGSWKDNAANIERAAAFLFDLPLSLDDSKERKSDQDIARVLYAHAAGLEKGRGKPDGNRRRSPWRSFLLSNGEASVLSMGKDGGARARTLVVGGSMLGGETEEHGKLAEEVERMALEHHGHLLPRVVRLILTNGGFEWLRETFQPLREYARDQATDNVSRRLSRAVAVLDLAKRLCEAVGLESPKGCDPMSIAMESCRASGADSDKPKEAMERLYAWCEANRDRFWWKGVKRPPPAGWAGRWDHTDDFAGVDRPTEWEWIGVFQAEVEAVLGRQGFDVPNAIAAWAQRGWLDCPPGKHRAKKVSLGGGRPRMLVIKRHAVEGSAPPE